LRDWRGSRGGKKGCSFWATNVSAGEYWVRWTSHISGVFRIPYFEQAVKSPFCASDTLLLVLLGIPGGEGLVGYGRPVSALVEVQES
jgi:hypothetical protein